VVIAAVLVGIWMWIGPASGQSGSDQISASGSSAPNVDSPADRSDKGSGSVDGSRVTFIGDSVGVAVKPTLLERFPGIDIYAHVNKRLGDLDENFDTVDSAGGLRDIVVVELGTNGTASQDTLDQALDRIGPDRQLIVVIPHGDHDWIAQAADELRDFAAAHPNQVTVADWDSVSAQVTDFAPDGIHPGPQGSGVFADVLEKALQQASQRLG
jgi:hypothetical protein